MTLLPPTASQLLSIQRELNPDPESIAQDISHLKLWLQKQDYLPDIEDEEFLHRFLHCCKYSLQRTKQVLDLYFMVRGSVADFFFNRDPTTSTVRLNATAVYLYALPSLTPDGFRVLMTKFVGSDNPSSSDMVSMIRRILMISDVSLQEDANHRGNVYTYDLAEFGLRHLKSFTLPLAKKSTLCTQDALPFRIRQIHLLNAPPLIDKLLAVFKPFLKKKIYNRIVVHTKGYDEFYKFVPRDMLPAEYGGKAASPKEFSDAWQTKIETYKDWFLKEEEKIQREVKRRPDKVKVVSDLLGMEGSFKQLAID